MAADRNRLGILLFILSEATFFAILITAQLYSHGVPNHTASSLEVVRTLFFSVFLLASSISVALAGRNLRHRRLGAARFWLGVTIVLGIIFLFGQLTEYRQLNSENIWIDTDVFSMTFYTLTGFHGLHVLAGLIALTILLKFANETQGERSSAVETISYYWHFVDGMWIIIFTVVYLLSAL